MINLKKLLFLKTVITIVCPYSIYAANYCKIDNSHLYLDNSKFKILNVIDGDTIKIRYFNNNKNISLRLTSINTQEINNNNHLAQDAKKELQKLVENNQNNLAIAYANQPYHYGRDKGNLIIKDSKILLASLMVAKGLAYAVAIGANNRYIDCLLQQEQLARHKKIGIWKNYKPTSIPNNGFSLIQTQIKNIDFTKKQNKRSNITLRLNNGFKAIIIANFTPLFNLKCLQNIKENIEIRGWFNKNKKSVTIYHPTSINIVRPNKKTYKNCA